MDYKFVASISLASLYSSGRLAFFSSPGSGAFKTSMCELISTFRGHV